MRLLRLEDDGNFSLVEYVGSHIPRYAILSHTWGADHEEVTFKDLTEGTGKNKAGYRKLAFCGKQAAKDGLQFFWADTCCIDKSSSAELSEAINSMFRWYQDAAKCYVYLSDVSIGGSVGGDLSSQRRWKPAFQHSKWFTRGWTLQELLAPTSVEFFTVEGEQLGDKVSLVQEIHDTTGISIQALQGSPLSQFSVDERMSWAERRKTKREEDAAYSLLGIFDIQMPLIYGEGQKKAFLRLQREINQSLGDESLALPPVLSTEQPKRNRKPFSTAPFSRDPVRTGESRDSSLPNNTAGPSSPDMVIVPDNTEKMTESERQAWFQNAVNERLNIPTGYFNAAVLVIRWHQEIDGFWKGRDDEIRELQELFHECFLYEYEEIDLNTSKKPQLILNNAVTQFVLKHDGPDNLLILYYTGHGKLRPGGESGLELIPAAFGPRGRNSGCARASWEDAEKLLLQYTEADVLAILDCFFASHTPKSLIEDCRTYELLAASPSGQTTPTPSPQSFTTALIKSLKALLIKYHNCNFTTTKLLDELNKNWNQTYMLWDRLGKRERHVQLAPLKDRRWEAREMSFRSQGPEQAWVTLRFSLKDPQLSREQIEGLANQLPTACKGAGIPVCRIDWIKMESTSSSSDPSLARPSTAVTATAGMRRRLGAVQSNPGQHSEAPQNKRQKMRSTMKRPSLSLSVQPQDEADLSSPNMLSTVSVVVSGSPSD